MERSAPLGSVSSAEEADVTADACEDRLMPLTPLSSHDIDGSHKRRDVRTSDCKVVD